MSIWEILWVLFIAASFLALVVSAFSAGREDQDVSCCRSTAIVICGFILLCYYVGAMQEPPVRDPKFFMIWNRSGREQITSYRHPSAYLSAEEYMMGVEMAKSNACFAFNFSKEEDIALFKRCAHFFPEFSEIYRDNHQATVGVTL
jgi:hypothetical protein